MYKISSDSGIEGSSGTCTAQSEFWNEYVAHLDSYTRQQEQADDPTIDLDQFAICPRNSNTKMIEQKRTMTENTGKSNKQDTPKRDLSLVEIECIVEHLKEGAGYGQKLAEIMLRGLQETLPKTYYRAFLEDGVPDFWCPIVKMNNDNKPYVEILIKSESADESAFSQLSQYTMDHMCLCQYVVKKVHDYATRKLKPQLAPPTKKPPIMPLARQKQIEHAPQQPKQKQITHVPQTPPRKQTSHTPQQQQGRMRTGHQQLPAQNQTLQMELEKGSVDLSRINFQQHTRSLAFPKCSTPKRVLPPRACKSVQKY